MLENNLKDTIFWIEFRLFESFEALFAVFRLPQRPFHQALSVKDYKEMVISAQLEVDAKEMVW